MKEITNDIELFCCNNEFSGFAIIGQTLRIYFSGLLKVRYDLCNNKISLIIIIMFFSIILFIITLFYLLPLSSPHHSILKFTCLSASNNKKIKEI